MQLVKKKTKQGEITAPEDFWGLSPDELRDISNGAGPKYFGWLVPDTMYGLNITLAADIHDYMYRKRFGKRLADKLFYDNLLAIINHHGGLLAPLRRARAWIYFQAVHRTEFYD